jgi:hypothetical protein
MSKLFFSLAAVLVAALALAGCGGQKVAADEVPGAPVALQVPEVSKGGSNALTGNSSSSSSSKSSDDSADADATATATPSGTGQTGTTGTTQSGNTGGTSGSTQQQTQQGNGTNGNTFDDFCKNNPGAC